MPCTFPGAQLTGTTLVMRLSLYSHGATMLKVIGAMGGAVPRLGAKKVLVNVVNRLKLTFAYPS